MNEALRNALVAAIVSGLLAAVIPIAIQLVTAGRRFGKLQGSVDHVLGRVDALDRRFDSLRGDVNEGFTSVTEKMGHLEVRVVDRIAKLEGRWEERTSA